MYMTLLRKFPGYFFLTLFFALIFLPLQAQSGFIPDSLLNQRIEHEGIVRGERLFYGLVHKEISSMNCAGCHSTRSDASSDTINWNPNALDISEKYLTKNANDLAAVLLKPAGQKMTAAHAGFKLSPEEIVLIKDYMDQIPEKGLLKEKPVLTKLLLFIIASVLFLISFTDLLITKKLQDYRIHFGILTLTTVFITYLLIVGAISIGRSQGYSPDQPVKFSHKVHAGQNGTDCIYCHSYAPYSKVAGFPSENVCMNCHLLVRTGTRSGMFEIAKVINAYENKIPIKWIQVHNLPDHAYYNHSQHVNAGGLDCRECHGQVQEMDRIVQVSDLSMGWCINCHRTRKVNFQENAFYAQYKELAGKMANGELDSVTVATQGGTECMRCHY